MKIKPEQKIYRGRDPYAQMVPIIDRRIAETNVIIRDEETVLLGGLRQDETNDVNTGTPWFMEIPVVGWFFKRNTTENIKLETVMFVTPHIIKEPALSELEKTQYEQIDYGWDLPAEFFKGKKEMPAAKK
jgi:type II secretory pathway component GspD/PulD (secretin)